MTSVMPPQPIEIKPPPSVRSKLAMSPVQEPTPPDNVKQEDSYDIKQEDDPDRDRPRSQTEDGDVDEFENDESKIGDADGSHTNSDGPARKRRRSRKCLDKKFECPEAGCGKSYSRAEHLYRHQLNHNPKQVYRCNIGDCKRSFVRLDLCNRHKDRHSAKGSALNRKDSMMSQTSPTLDGHQSYASAGSVSPEVNRPGAGFAKGRNVVPYSPKDAMGSPFTPITNTPPLGYPHNARPNGGEFVHSDSGYQQRVPHHASPGSQRPAVHSASVGPYGVLSPVSTQQGYHSQPTNTPHSTATMPQFVQAQNFTPFSLPPSNFGGTASAAVSREPQAQQGYAPPSSGEYTENAPSQASGEMMLLNQMSMPATMPVFGSDGVLNKSPYVGMPEDFMAYLFNTQQGDGSPISGVQNPGYNYADFPPNQYNMPYSGTDPSQMGYFPSAPQQIMSVTSLLDRNLPESVISDEKSAEIFELIRERFHEDGQTPIERQRETILEGDRQNESHMLSRKMMQQYIISYWYHFSEQIPILHKPTFSPDKTPNLLLIAMMAIGAACLDKAHGHKVTKAGAQLSNFLAWHLRWEMFQHPHCRPPAKLWVFQTLLLLELYEKMYSTRELHERAHIHHATTITLMRRGRALMGKSALDSPPNLRDDKQNGSRHSSTSGLAHTPDEWWNHWIANEATRRAAFAAFLIDSIHATMFGHSTVMVAHEMRLPLPCDDKLWKATSGAEVGRIETKLMTVGSKPISFLEGLKRMLCNQEVHTNAFGRTVLMAGLLSVSWHMNQRDLQVNSLGNGVSQALGGRDKWRSTVIRAFDHWKADFDRALQKEGLSPDPYYNYDPSGRNNDVVFESRIALHHLAHMAMHVDIVDCQIYARAKRLLGRAIGPQDLHSAERRMKDIWALSAKARDATFYALKFLTSVLLPESSGPSRSTGYTQAPEAYSARDDVLLNRPWVLYFATLVVWCYGYALEGPCPDLVVPTSQHERARQMQDYLLRYSSVTFPDELRTAEGINRNTALLMVLKETFETTRWELLNEGATLLNNCVQLNSGMTVP